MPAEITSRVEEAIEFAALHGLLKKSPEGRLVHAPFALTPCPIDADSNRRLEALSAPFNRLVDSVSKQLEFLQEALADAAAADAFTDSLLKMAAASGPRQALQFQITRSDYFLQAPPQGEAPPLVRQVELNTIASSYPGSAGRLYLLHRHLFAGTAAADRLVPNDPLPGLAEGFFQAFRCYGHENACVLMVVQPAEGNVFDQRLLELALRERGIPVLRLPLEEIAARGRLLEGHLAFSGQVAAVTYFRAGYTPDDFPSPDAFKGRELIENSSTISVPNLATQLAGTKKVQQLLTDGATLRRFCDEKDARAMEATFAAIYDLDDEVQTPDGPTPAWKAAARAPGQFVLKPQREGGGNNLYDEELAARLSHSSPEERKAYVLMERIRPIPHHAAVVADGRLKEEKSVSEIGRFGVYLADGPRELMNIDAGYLVRTKGHEVREGGVTAGYAYLNSLIEEPPPHP